MLSLYTGKSCGLSCKEISLRHHCCFTGAFMRSFTFIEVFVYNLLRVIPLLVMAFYPFYDKKRFSRPVTLLICNAIVLLWLADSITNSYYTNSRTRMAVIEIFGIVLIVALYALAFKAHPGKMLFFCFMLFNVGYMITTVAKCLEGFLFPDTVLDGYRWTASICLALVMPFILLPVFFFFRWERETLTEEKQPVYVWQYCWLVPVTFYLTWSHEFYGKDDPLLWSLSVRNVFMLFIVNLAAFLIYYLILRMIKDNADYMKLREENHVLSMELMQYDGLNQRIALARQGRHDLRHHILTMETLLDSGDVPALRSYLAEIGEKYQVEGALTFCSNRTVNGILTYFAEIANAKEIEFNVRIGIPEDVPVAKTDLSVLFGNLLENAIEACQKQSSGPRKIIVRSQMSQNTLALTVDNTYETIPEKDRLGRFRSMKHSGEGVGTESVKNIVSRYDGVVQFETRGDLFCVSAMLYLQEPEQSVLMKE